MSYRVETIANLLRDLNVPDSALFGYIKSEQKDIKSLKLCLELLSTRMQVKKLPKIRYNPHYLFQIIKCNQSDELWVEFCSLFPFILSIQDQQSQKEIMDDVKNMTIINRLMYLKLLNILLTHSDNLNSFDKDFILEVRNDIPVGSTAEIFFFARSIVKEWFVKHTICREDLLQAFIKRKDIIILKHLIPELSTDECKFFDNDFWGYVCKELSQSQHTKQRDILVSLIEAYVTRMCLSDSNFKVCNYFLGTTTNKIEFQLQWDNFRKLIYIVHEQQLHLLIPAFPLLNTVQKLHFDFRLCLLKPLLCQKHPSIAYPALSYLLEVRTDNLDEYKELGLYLINGFNRNDCGVLYEELLTYIETLDEDQWLVLAKQSATCVWVPNAAYYFYKAILHRRLDVKNLEILIPILRNLQKLPHKYIRDGCYDMIFRYYSETVSKDLDFQMFVKISSEFFGYNSRYISGIAELVIKYFSDSKSLKYLHEELIRLFEGYKVSDNLKMLLALVRNCRLCKQEPFDSLLVDNTENITPVIADAVFYYLCQDTKQAEKYIERRLEEVDSKSELDYLIGVIENIEICNAGIKPIIVQNSEEVLTHLKHFDDTKLFVAIQILKHYDESCDIFNREWIHFINDRECMSEKACLSCLELLSRRKPLKEFNMKRMMEVITQTQPQTVINYMYDRLVMLVAGYLKNRVELEATFSFLFGQLRFIKKKEDQRFCLRGFLKAFLPNCYDFEIEKWEDALKSVLIDFNAESILLDTFDPSVTPASFHKLLYQLSRFGPLYTKERSIEYVIFKEIYLQQGTLTKAYKNSEELTVRLKALYALSKMSYATDDFVPKKKYFPDSEDHMSWLRLLQGTLVLFPLISKASKEQKDSLFEIMVTYLTTVTHHGSVRQLLQWFLIKLSITDESYSESIKELYETNKDSVMVSCAIIPILYHVAMAKEQAGYAIDVVHVLREATMGANFKQRAYSQVVTLRLLDLKLRNHSSYIEYKSLHETLDAAVADNKASIDKVMKSDKEFIEDFHPERSYHLRTIFWDVPKLNGVISMEWDSLDYVLEENPEIGEELLPFGPGKTRMNIEDRISATAKHNPEVRATGNVQMKPTPILHAEKSWVHDVILVASFVTSAANLGGLARSCEIYGIRTMLLQDLKVVASKEFQSLSMSSERLLDVQQVKLEDLEERLKGLKENGYTVIGAEQTSDSVKLQEYTFPEKSVIVLGNEQQGIPASFLPVIDVCVEVPQYGLTRSLNVHVAGAIFVWEYVRQKLQIPPS